MLTPYVSRPSYFLWMSSYENSLLKCFTWVKGNWADIYDDTFVIMFTSSTYFYIVCIIGSLFTELLFLNNVRLYPTPNRVFKYSGEPIAISLPEDIIPILSPK